MRGVIAGIIVSFVVFVVSSAFAVNDLTTHNIPDNHRAINRVVARHNVAINDLRQLIKIACGARVFEDGSFVAERDDDVRYMCLEFVSQINR